MPKCSDSDDENDDDIPLANLFNIRNRLDQIGFTMDDLVNVDREVVSTESKSDDDIVGRGGFRGGVRGVGSPPPKIRKAYVIQH